MKISIFKKITDEELANKLERQCQQLGIEIPMVEEETKTTELFMKNADSGEPYAHCGTLVNNKECGVSWEKQQRELQLAIGRLVMNDAEDAHQLGDKALIFQVKLIDMTKEELEKIPDM